MAQRANLLSLFESFDRFANNVAVAQRRGYRREVCTYAQLKSRSLDCARLLQAASVAPGDRVMLWGPNSAEWMAAFWGCLSLGAIAVPMDDAASTEFVSRIISDASVKTVFLSGAHRSAHPSVFASCKNIFDLDDLPDTLAALPRSINAPIPDTPITADSVAQILFTSGTTSEPRGVVLTHGNFLANLAPLELGLDRYRRYERWFHPLRFVSVVPLSHVFGQFMALFVPPLLGAAIVFEPGVNPQELLRTIKRERATALIAVPRILDLLRSALSRSENNSAAALASPEKFQAAKSKKFLHRAWLFRRIHFRLGLKFWVFISGGAQLLPTTEHFFKAMGYAVVQGYGMTETASLISLNNPFSAAEGSIGKVLPGREFRLADDGEILVRGASVSSSYFQKGSFSAAPTANELPWLQTGDLGALDPDSNLIFRGRKKNVIVTAAGLNIYPEDLQAALRPLPGVLDCVVISFERDAELQPCAVLLLAPSHRNDAAAIVAQANSTLADFQKIRCFLPWPELDFPRTPTGKPRIGLISLRANDLLQPNNNAAPPPTAASSATASPSVASLLDQLQSNSAPQSAIDLNLNSLDRVELLTILEQKFHLELNETAFAEARNISDLRALLDDPPASPIPYHYPRWTQLALTRAVRLFTYYALVYPATLILAHPKIIGRENLRDLQGPALFVSNHITRRADIGLDLIALPPRFRHNLATAMGGESLLRMRTPPRDWWFAKRLTYIFGYWLVTALFNVFPLPQFSGFRESFRFAAESVDRGYSLLVYPEGLVTSTGEIAPFQPGIGILAQDLRLPVVPMRIDGVFPMKQQGRRLARRNEITIHIGAPLTFAAPASPADIAHALQSALRHL